MKKSHYSSKELKKNWNKFIKYIDQKYSKYIEAAAMYPAAGGTNNLYFFIINFLIKGLVAYTPK